MEDATVAVMLIEWRPDDVRVSAANKPFTAYLVSNPSVRADGYTEEDVLHSLRQRILSHMGAEGVLRKRAVSLTL